MTQFVISERTTLSIRGLALDSRKLAGTFFLILAAGFMTIIMLAAAMVPGYDFRGAAISDLGVFPETALLFNTSLVLVGVLNLAGGYLFYRTHGKRWLLDSVRSAALLGGDGARTPVRLATVPAPHPPPVASNPET